MTVKENASSKKHRNKICDKVYRKTHDHKNSKIDNSLLSGTFGLCSNLQCWLNCSHFSTLKNIHLQSQFSSISFTQIYGYFCADLSVYKLSIISNKYRIFYICIFKWNQQQDTTNFTKAMSVMRKPMCLNQSDLRSLCSVYLGNCHHWQQ